MTRIGRRTLIAVGISVSLLVAGIAAWYATRPGIDDGPPYTVAEFLALDPFPSPSGTVYPIEDVVLSSSLARTPGLAFNGTRFDVTPGSRMNFTFVVFQSMSDRKFFFFGDRVVDFPAEIQVRFNVTFQEWTYYRGQTVVDIEHNYIQALLHDYEDAIFRGDYRPFAVNTTIANGWLSIRITGVDDVIPLPLNWGNVYVSFWTSATERVPGPRNGTLLSDGTVVADLRNPNYSLFGLRNQTLDLVLAPLQEIRTAWDGSYSVVRFEAPGYVGTVFP